MSTDGTFNTKHLSPINDYYHRCAQAIDDLEWDGELDHADVLREELRHIEQLKEQGHIYVPLF